MIDTTTLARTPMASCANLMLANSAHQNHKTLTSAASDPSLLLIGSASCTVDHSEQPSRSSRVHQQCSHGGASSPMLHAPGSWTPSQSIPDNFPPTSSQNRTTFHQTFPSQSKSSSIRSADHPFSSPRRSKSKSHPQYLPGHHYQRRYPKDGGVAVELTLERAFQMIKVASGIGS